MISLLLSLAMVDPASDHLRHPGALTAETRALAQPYWDCVMRRARELEPSAETASDIAAAAVTSCDEQRSQLQAAIDIDFIARGPQAGRVPDPIPTDEIMADFDQRLIAAARLIVIEARTQRVAR